MRPNTQYYINKDADLLKKPVVVMVQLVLPITPTYTFTTGDGSNLSSSTPQTEQPTLA